MSKIIKYCVVKSCVSNSRDHPEKLFISIPKKESRRQLWYKALNTTKIADNPRNCVCEDHFDVSIVD